MTLKTRPRSDLTPLVCGWQDRDPAKPPMLLIHGVGLRAEAWQRMMPALAAHYALTLIDLPGHGSSAGFETDPTSVRDYAGRVQPVLQRVGAPTIVVGHSMGALIAMDLAILCPELVAAIAPLNAVFRRDAAAAAAVQKRAGALAGKWMMDPTETLARWFGPAPAGELRDMAVECRSWLQSVDPVGYRQAYSVFAHADGPDDADLARITCPALFVTGADEPNSTPAMSRTLAQRVSQGQSAIIDGARHMMPMTHAAQVSDLLIRFLQAAEAQQ